MNFSFNESALIISDSEGPLLKLSRVEGAPVLSLFFGDTEIPIVAGDDFLQMPALEINNKATANIALRVVGAEGQETPLFQIQKLVNGQAVTVQEVDG